MQDELIQKRDSSRQASSGFLMLISLASAMGGFLFGYETVVIAGTVSLIKSQFILSAAAEGWFVSSGLAGCVAGVLIAGRAGDAYGRKKMLLMAGILLTISSIGCAFSPDIGWLIFFRIVGGAGVGLTSIISPLYISEIAPPRQRGRLVSLFQLSITVGIVAAMAANAALISGTDTYKGEGGWFSLLVREVWRVMFLLQGIPSFLFFVSALLIPDSPRWLASKERNAQALGILSKLRGDQQEALQELQTIQRAISVEPETISQLFQPGLRGALLLGIFLAIFSELSGITVVMYYGPVILENAGFSINHSLSGHAIIGGVLAACTLFAVWLVDRYGRVRLLITGISGCLLSLLSIGILFLSGNNSGNAVIVLLCVFVAFFAFSLGPVKWIIISEIFPTRIRARAMSIATLALWSTDILLNQFFPVIRDRYGIAAMFLLFSAFLLIHLVVACTKIPETKGMSLERIGNLWKQKNI